MAALYKLIEKIISKIDINTISILIMLISSILLFLPLKIIQDNSIQVVVAKQRGLIFILFLFTFVYQLIRLSKWAYNQTIWYRKQRCGIKYLKNKMTNEENEHLVMLFYKHSDNIFSSYTSSELKLGVQNPLIQNKVISFPSNRSEFYYSFAISLDNSVYHYLNKKIRENKIKISNGRIVWLKSKKRRKLWNKFEKTN